MVDMDLDDLLDEFDPEQGTNKSTQNQPQQPTVSYSDRPLVSSNQTAPKTVAVSNNYQPKPQQIQSSGIDDEDWDFDGDAGAGTGGANYVNKMGLPASNTFNSAAASSNDQKISNLQKSKTQKAAAMDDFDQFLEDCGADETQAKPQQAAQQQPSIIYSDKSASNSFVRSGTGNFQRQGTLGGTKCFPLFIGGSSLPNGQTNSSSQPMSCEALRCSACDKKVVRFFDNVKWASHVDYMFVRNFNTSVDRLREGVEPAAGFACYACQCQHLSLDSASKRVDEYQHLRWHCRGH